MDEARRIAVNIHDLGVALVVLLLRGCGHAESKKALKFVLRTALRPNQIEFSHSLGPLLPRVNDTAVSASGES
jgi:hypothetical protein